MKGIMQKWEYLTLEISLILRKNNWVIDLAAIDERPSNEWKGKFRRDLLNSVGNDGWEMVTRSGSVYHFKRPVE